MLRLFAFTSLFAVECYAPGARPDDPTPVDDTAPAATDDTGDEVTPDDTGADDTGDTSAVDDTGADDTGPGCDDPPTWYYDADGDGIGDLALPMAACEAPAGYAAESGDCDDLDPAIAPGLEDVCGDGVDADCDGVELTCRIEGVFQIDDDGLIWTGEDAADEAGNALATGDFDGDGAVDLVVGAVGASPPAVAPPTSGAAWAASGAAYVVYGPLTADGSLADADTITYGDVAGTWVGVDVGVAGDINGDGLADLMIGATEAGVGSPSGKVWLRFGAPRGEVAPELAIQLIASGHTVDIELGASVSGPGDFDGDGLDDIFLGGSGGSGFAFAFTSGKLPASGDVNVLDADIQIYGNGLNTGANLRAEGVGDLDGDGLADLGLGVPAENATYLYNGYTGFTTYTFDAGFATIGGGGPDSWIGIGVGAGGDIDGDGYDDLVVNGLDDAWVFSGPITGDVDISVATATVLFEDLEPAIGSGDMDDDGYSDVLLGSRDEIAFLFYGPLTGTELAYKNADAMFGEGSETMVVAPPADITGDGLMDVVTGAPGHGSSPLLVEQGAVVIFPGF